MSTLSYTHRIIAPFGRGSFEAWKDFCPIDVLVGTNRVSCHEIVRFSLGGIHYNTDAASNTADVQYFFNKARQMTKLTDWTGDLEYRYSDIGQLTKLIDYDDAELTYAYDAVGRVTSMTDYHGATTAYEYDNGGRMTLLTAPGSKVWEFVYNDLGQPIETYNLYGSAAKPRFFQCNPGGLKGLTRIVTWLRGGHVWLFRKTRKRASDVSCVAVPISLGSRP